MQIYRKTIKSIAASAGPRGASMIESLDSIFDNLDKKDEELADQSNQYEVNDDKFFISILIYRWSCNFSTG